MVLYHGAAKAKFGFFVHDENDNNNKKLYYFTLFWENWHIPNLLPSSIVILPGLTELIQQWQQ
jgi:hypothetical protein